VPWLQLAGLTAGVPNAAFVWHLDLREHVQDMLGSAFCGQTGVLDLIGCQDDFLAERSGAFDFHVQDRAGRVADSELRDLVLTDMDSSRVYAGEMGCGCPGNRRPGQGSRLRDRSMQQPVMGACR